MQNNRNVITLPEMIRRSACEFKHRPALIAREPQENRVITFGELGSKVKSLAKMLHFELKRNNINMLIVHGLN